MLYQALGAVFHVPEDPLAQCSARDAMQLTLA